MFQAHKTSCEWKKGSVLKEKGVLLKGLRKYQLRMTREEQVAPLDFDLDVQGTFRVMAVITLCV